MVRMRNVVVTGVRELCNSLNVRMGVRMNAKNSMPHLLVEIAFALLPLLVLGAFWPEHDSPHPNSIWSGPEISMIACILYGLSIARFIEGIGRSGRAFQGGAVSTIVIIALVGVICSIIIIAKASNGCSSMWVAMQIFNLFASVIAFIVIGGYGISRSCEAKRDTTK